MTTNEEIALRMLSKPEGCRVKEIQFRLGLRSERGVGKIVDRLRRQGHIISRVTRVRLTHVAKDRRH